MPTTGVSFNMKQELLKLVNNAFVHLEEVKIYSTATLLDPRFKKVGFYQDALTQKRVYDAVSHLGKAWTSLKRERGRASRQRNNSHLFVFLF